MTNRPISSPFRFAIVGTGNISRTYLSALANIEDGAVTAFVSRSGRRPDGAPEALPVFPSIAEAAAGCPFDAVILCTPNGLHHEGAAEAASLGKHVLTEKVLDISRANMDAMEAACTEAGVQLAVCFQRRMSPHNQAVKSLLQSGALGRIFAVDVRVKFFRDDAYYASGDYRGGFATDGGGPFIQQAAHQVDLLCWFFGLPEKVVSMLGTFVHEGIECEDHGVALMRYPDGSLVTLTASSACRPGFPGVVEIHSDRGSLEMVNDEITRWQIDGVPNPAEGEAFTVHSGADSAAVADTAGHEAVLRDFIEAVRQDRPPSIPARSARLATELVLRIYQSQV
jgi:predicted dehydrogenase